MSFAMFAPPPPDETHRAKPKLCGECQDTDCPRGHKCILYKPHPGIPHRADHCHHRWENEDGIEQPA